MKSSNPLYNNIGVHVISSIFTVEKGIIKVLLVKRNNEPYKGKWSLVGGALYNDELLIDGMRREIEEKTGIKNTILYFSSVVDKIDRSPIRRMIAMSYIGIINSEKVSILKETLKTTDADWIAISNVKKLAYDHNDILDKSIITLREKITSSDILKSLFPNGFTIPEIQKTYETILDKTFDRRNFRKKLLSLNLIEDTGEYVNFEGKKPAKLYRFKKYIENKNLF